MQSEQQTSLMEDIGRGLRGRCPHCGEGKLFRKFLKVVDQCPVCGEEFHHHRADDFPSYIVVLLLGHIMVPLSLFIEEHYAPPSWFHLAFTLPFTFLLAIGLLQPVKGVVVAVQWRLGMHGFKDSKLARKNP